VSLILDALRKADSEREREAVPGLHTQPMAPLSLETSSPAQPTPWRWIALSSIALLVAALAWVLVDRTAPPAPERAVATEPAATSEPHPAPAPNAVMPNAAMPNAVAPSTVVPTAANVAAEAPNEIAPPAPWPAPERKAAPKESTRANGPAEAAAGTKSGGVPAVYARDALPDGIRSALPPLAVSGSIYSSTPANRSLILDGRLYRENDLVATDLTLEEIRQKTAVLRFRDYRFEIRY
jgi:general secretion pathway protein B